MSLRLAPGSRLVVASHNPGKVREIAELLAPLRVEAVSARELALAEPEETGTTFAANAELKALAAADVSGLPALADDSGLEVAALGGEPGIYSARWAGPEKDFARAMRNVEEKLQSAGARDVGTKDEGVRAANFTCALALAFPEGQCHIFEGKVFGSLVWPPRGSNGFGYDPMFLPRGGTLTFGEMEPDAKHAISHRARAFSHFLDAVRAG